MGETLDYTRQKTNAAWSPKLISSGLAEATGFLDGTDRAASVIPLLEEAEKIYPTVDNRRRLLWAAIRDNDIPRALSICRSLVETYSQLSGPTARKALTKIKRLPLYCLALLDEIEVVHRPKFEPVRGRLLYILNYSLPQVSNGYATRGHGMALGMQRCGLDVVCLTRPGFPLDLRPPKDFAPCDVVDGVKYFHDKNPILLGTSNMSDYVSEAAGVIEKRIRELRPEVVMAASNFNNSLPALIAARRLGIPFWYEVRGFWEITRLSNEPEIEHTFNYKLQRALEILVARNSDRIFTLNQPMREELVERGVRPKSIDLVPNSCDPSRFAPMPYDAQLANRLGIPTGVPVIGYVGSFAPYEGLDDLVRVCSRLRKDGHQFRLLLVGGETGADSSKGPVTHKIQQIAKEEGLGDWLIMTGRIPHEHVEAHYSLVDIAPFPRKNVPVTELVSPLKPLEALAMEKAIVVSSLRALKDMVKHESTGLVFEKDDLNSLSQNLVRLISSPELRNRLGKAGRQWVINERTWVRSAEKIAQAVTDLENNTSFEEFVKKNGFSDAEQILYADIDLNVIDGSSIWMSSMASILAAHGKVILISKRRIHRPTVIDNIQNSQNVLIISPEHVGERSEQLTMPHCIDLIRKLDHTLPGIRKVIVRGLAASVEILSDRQFHGRVYTYLTDLYEHKDAGLEIKDEARVNVDTLARQSAAFLVQTSRIEKLLRQLTNFPFSVIELPPPVPDYLVDQQHLGNPDQSVTRIGYAGKIAPNWGIRDLILWVEALREEGCKIEVTIIGDKVGGAATPDENKQFRKEINAGLDRIGAVRLGALDRDSVIREMQRMDFAWCWRPSDFENQTLELSTKLIEGVAAGIPCIAYPSPTNVECLGQDYTFFVRSLDDLREILKGSERSVQRGLRADLHARHSINSIAERFYKLATQQPSQAENTRVCFAGHDPKFVFPYYSRLKKQGKAIVFDKWNWGQAENEDRSRAQLSQNDVVFCEWGLANAVWYSNNLPEGPKLVVRVHLQEINGSARKFGHAIRHARVDAFIFVSARVRDEALKIFGFPAHKCHVIPNFVLEQEYLPVKKDFSGHIRLGMVGIAPERKRFDRAVDLANELAKSGLKTELHIKGKRPETIPFMQTSARAHELEYYFEQYKKIEMASDRNLSVIFHDWGNDVARFYECVDYILSPSDFESFHYALADGVLSGCYPIVWDWDEASDIYCYEWLVSSIDMAVDRIFKFRAKVKSEQEIELQANRELVVGRYGSERIFAELDRLVFSPQKLRTEEA